MKRSRLAMAILGIGLFLAPAAGANTVPVNPQSQLPDPTVQPVKRYYYYHYPYRSRPYYYHYYRPYYPRYYSYRPYYYRYPSYRYYNYNYPQYYYPYNRGFYFGYGW